MTNKERISGVDTAWLRMEHPTNLMMIVGVMMFERPLRLADVRRTIETRFLAFPRFRQRAVQEGSSAWWETDESLDLSRHVRAVKLPGKAGKRELEALVSRLASTPLDFSRPLWEFHLVQDYRGGSALVTRIHHCYADGMALIQVMLSLTGATAAASLAPPQAPAAEDESPPREKTPGEFLERMLAPLAGALAGGVPDLARKGLGFASEVARLATMGPDAPTRFKGKLQARKRAAWADPLPLDEVKAVGRALGCSINDVLLSMAAGALRDYLQDHGDPVDGLEIRAIVPVNLRAAGDGRGLGNHFGLVFLELPIGIEHPLERLYEVRHRMRALKGSYQPLIALGLLNAVGYGPRALQEQVTAMLGNSASAVMTNVPGPQSALYFAGQRIAELDFWVPQSGGIGMGVSILSYDGRIHFGLITDTGLVPDPNRIVERFGDEFDKLMWLTLMSPWSP
jgi:diacylglycerol O-acyltransferase / wax synthase